jgi:hypothetical protein
LALFFLSAFAPAFSFPGNFPAPLRRLQVWQGLKRWVLCLLLFSASGLQLDFAQMTAWGFMWIRLAEGDSMLGAISKTFEKESRCPMCLAIEAARKKAAVAEDLFCFSKAPLLPLVFGGAVFSFSGAARVYLRASRMPPSDWRFEPPHPPPRA